MGCIIFRPVLRSESGARGRVPGGLRVRLTRPWRLPGPARPSRPSSGKTPVPLRQGGQPVSGVVVSADGSTALMQFRSTRPGESLVDSGPAGPPASRPRCRGRQARTEDPAAPRNRSPTGPDGQLTGGTSPRPQPCPLSRRDRRAVALDAGWDFPPSGPASSSPLRPHHRRPAPVRRGRLPAAAGARSGSRRACGSTGPGHRTRGPARLASPCGACPFVSGQAGRVVKIAAAPEGSR